MNTDYSGKAFLANAIATDVKLMVTLGNKIRAFHYPTLDDAVSAAHRTAREHGYVCLVDYVGDEPQLSWTFVRMSDNHTVGRAYVATHRGI